MNRISARKVRFSVGFDQPVFSIQTVLILCYDLELMDQLFNAMRPGCDQLQNKIN